MHGADPELPISCVASASMTTEKVFETQLGKLAATVDAHPGSDPLMLLYGLRPTPEAAIGYLGNDLALQHGAS